MPPPPLAPAARRLPSIGLHVRTIGALCLTLSHVLPPSIPHQVAPHTAPRAATALHKLARRLTKAHMLRLGEHLYQLHRHLDRLQDWLHPSRGGGGAPLHSR